MEKPDMTDLHKSIEKQKQTEKMKKVNDEIRSLCEQVALELLNDLDIALGKENLDNEPLNKKLEIIKKYETLMAIKKVGK